MLFPWICLHLTLTSAGNVCGRCFKSRFPRFCLNVHRSWRAFMRSFTRDVTQGKFSQRCRMRDFRQKEKKRKLPQKKPSRDEPCLRRCNTSSMVGSADPRNMAALTQFISSAMRTFWPRLCCTCFCSFVVVSP